MIGIVTARGDEDPCCRELREAADRQGGGQYIDPLSLIIDVGGRARLLASDVPFEGFDAVILRGLNRDGDIDMQFEAFELMETLGIPVLNPASALSAAESKPVTLFRLHRAGLPVPRTLVTQRVETALEHVRALGTAVIKPLFGALGIGVERVTWPDVPERVRKSLDEWRAICIQEYVLCDGRDIRAFVVGGEILGAVMRIAQGAEWRTNVHQGGVCVPYELSAYERELCLQAASLIGLEYTGIDLLPGPDGPVLLEVNGAPQWHGLAAATGIDVAGAIIAHALALARRRAPRAPI